MSDLQPCPFCEDGGDVFEYAMFPGDVGCRECTASAPKSAWNRRAPPSADAEDAARLQWLINTRCITVSPPAKDGNGMSCRYLVGNVARKFHPDIITVREAIDAARREGGT